MKISIIGAGNVGGLTAMRLAQEGGSEIVLVDIAADLAQGKAKDLEDAQMLLKYSYSIRGTDDLAQIKDSDIVVMTAGLPRKPGMTREDLLNKNAQILKSICLKIKELASGSLVIIVTNPLDLMTRYSLEITGFKPNKVLGMGISLDAARFANLIAQELRISPLEVNPCVIGSHGEGMLPLGRLTTVKNLALDEFLDDKKIKELACKTIGRGLEIVILLGSGSAYFAPSAAILEIIRAVAKDEKRVIGVSTYLNGEYGLEDICLGLPCRLGKTGVEKIMELDLNQEEKAMLLNSAANLKEQFNALKDV